MKSVWVDQVPYRSVSDEPHGYYHVILQRCSVSNRATSTDVLFDFFFFQTYMFIQALQCSSVLVHVRMPSMLSSIVR